VFTGPAVLAVRAVSLGDKGWRETRRLDDRALARRDLAGHPAGIAGLLPGPLTTRDATDVTPEGLPCPAILSPVPPFPVRRVQDRSGLPMCCHPDPVGPAGPLKAR
jgi:hypothetical protein